MKKLTDKQKLELLRDLMSNSSYEEAKDTLESRLLTKIHRIFHPYEGCQHLDWEDEAIGLYREIKK